MVRVAVQDAVVVLLLDVLVQEKGMEGEELQHHIKRKLLQLLCRIGSFQNCCLKTVPVWKYMSELIFLQMEQSIR